MKKEKQTHIHKFEKIILGGRKIIRKEGKRYIEKCGGTEVMKCMLPGCKTWILFELACGQPTRCWQCNEELILSKENMKLKKPTHIWCRRVRENIA
jgi:hypothetical protein